MMKFDADFFSSATGQVLLVGAVLALGAFAVARSKGSNVKNLPAPKAVTAASMPKTIVREGARFENPPPAPAVPAEASSAQTQTPAKPKVPLTSLTLAVDTTEPKPAAVETAAAPYGRLIPCQTVVALESNRLDTPVIGLVTEDVWHAGKLIVPAGAEVHAKAALDRTRERLAVTGAWHLVWRTPDTDNGLELTVEGLALDRDQRADGTWGESDGSAGLRGDVVKSSGDRELRVFAATFLSAATAALQDTRTATGFGGETSVPAATARNATLAGAGAVLRDYATAMREAITRDGLYLRVPAGKPFYLYVTQTLDRSQARRAAPSRL